MANSRFNPIVKGNTNRYAVLGRPVPLSPAYVVDDASSNDYLIHSRQSLLRYKKHHRLHRELRTQRRVEVSVIGAFLDLPGEIRNSIYKYALGLKDPVELWPAVTGFDHWKNREARLLNAVKLRGIWKEKCSVRLLRTCKQIHAEASAIFYGNEFCFSGSNGHIIACGWISKIGLRNLSYVKSLTVDMPHPTEKSRWVWFCYRDLYCEAELALPSHGFLLNLNYFTAWHRLTTTLACATGLRSMNLIFHSGVSYHEEQELFGRGLKSLVAAKPFLEVCAVRLYDDNSPQAGHRLTSLVRRSSFILSTLRMITDFRVRLATLDSHGGWQVVRHGYGDRPKASKYFGEVDSIVDIIPAIRDLFI